MTNKEVAQSWASGRSASTQNLSTDGRSLYSYKLLIGFTATKGEKIALQYQASAGSEWFRSRTTSCHVSLAMSQSDQVAVPDEKNLFKR